MTWKMAFALLLGLNTGYIFLNIPPPLLHPAVRLLCAPYSLETTAITSVTEGIELSTILAAGTVTSSLQSECTKIGLTFRAAI
jgi:hypothetical protein